MRRARQGRQRIAQLSLETTSLVLHFALTGVQSPGICFKMEIPDRRLRDRFQGHLAIAEVQRGFVFVK
jgi:hypothetical protein